MAMLARDGVGSDDVRNTARTLTQSLAQKDFTGEASRIFYFVRDKIRYVKDPSGLEMLHTPAILLQIKAGDCDDKAILAAALLLSIGHRVRFVAIGLAPGQFSHVWLQDFLNGKWVDLETTEPVEFGQSVPTGGVRDWLFREV